MSGRNDGTDTHVLSFGFLSDKMYPSRIPHTSDSYLPFLEGNKHLTRLPMVKELRMVYVCEWSCDMTVHDHNSCHDLKVKNVCLYMFRIVKWLIIH